MDKNSVSCGVDIRFYSPDSSSHVFSAYAVLFLVLVISFACLLAVMFSRRHGETQAFAPLFNDKQLLKVRFFLQIHERRMSLNDEKKPTIGFLT